jgi:PAS domain S-box-containing protein
MMRDEISELRARLEEAEEMLRAIRAGEVDALVVEGDAGPQLYTLQGVDAESNRFRGEFLAQVSDSVIATDKDERISFINAAAERQYDVRASDVLGRNLAAVFTPKWSSREAEAEMRNALAEFGEWRGELMHRTHNGREFFVETTVTLLRAPNGVTAAGHVETIRDITERKQAEAALRESEERVRSQFMELGHVYEHATVGLCTLDLELRYVRINERLAEINGIPAAAHIGRTVREMVPTLADAIEEVTARILATNLAVENHEFSGQTAAEPGITRYWDESWYPLQGPGGKIIGFGGVVEEITKRKQAEAALRQNAELFSRMIDQAPGGIYVVDAQLRILKMNSEAMLEFATVQPLIGRDLDEVLEIIMGPESGPPIGAIFRHTLATGEPYTLPCFNARRHDLGVEQTYDWEVQRVTLPDGQHGVVCYFQNVTERIRRERNPAFLADLQKRIAPLSSAEEIMSEVSACLADLLSLTHCLFVDVDETAEICAVVHDHHVAGTRNLEGVYHIADFHSAEERQLFALGGVVAIADVRDGAAPTSGEHFEALGIRSYINAAYVTHGRWKFLMNASRAEPTDWAKEDVELIREVAERTYLRIERARAESALRESERALQEEAKRKDEFLAMLAHELRNPLAPLRTAMQILNIPGATAADRIQSRIIIARQIDNMSRMIDDLLDVSRISEGKIELRKQAVELQPILADAAQNAAPDIEANSQTLEIHVPDEPVFLNADPTRLEQILGNLLGNACKYSGHGTHISLSAEITADHQAVIRVADNGIGIDPELLPVVFDLFVQSSRARDRAHGGLGIGLTIVDRLVKLHGGRIEARSEGLGTGAEFIMHLPLLETPPPKASVVEDNATTNSPLRLLIVDDNRDAAETMAMLQKFLGHDTRVAYTGPDALTVAAEFVPEVVLLDIGLPDMDGFEVARRIRLIPQMENSFLIALTGYAARDDRMQSSAAGFNAHLAKPADLNVLRELLQSAIPGLNQNCGNPEVIDG